MFNSFSWPENTGGMWGWALAFFLADACPWPGSGSDVITGMLVAASSILSMSISHT